MAAVPLLAASCFHSGIETDFPSYPQTERMDFEDTSYTVVPIDSDLEFFRRDDAGNSLRTFSGLREWVNSNGREIVFATNGGIFEPGPVPTGLWIAEGDEQVPLNLSDGHGNFFLKPNGVFFLDGKSWRIMSTTKYSQMNHKNVQSALQSGPLLVEKGVIHPAFSSDSQSRRVRSGVGVSGAGHPIFVVSAGPVNFHDFARFFVRALNCDDALYLDGEISAFYFGEDSPANEKEYASFLAVVE